MLLYNSASDTYSVSDTLLSLTPNYMHKQEAIFTYSAINIIDIFKILYFLVGYAILFLIVIVMFY